MKQIVYLAGLPRSGSTLLSNVLAMHPNVHSTPSSPLCAIVQNMRRQWSDDHFLLSQLDSDFEVVHNRLQRSTRAFMQAWSDETTRPIVVDKNRAWIFAVEWLRELDPDFKVIVTLRDLKDVYTSIEKQHRKTLFIEFPDHMEHNSVDGRANALFADGGLLGSVLKGIQNLGDVHDIERHIYYWRYEDFLIAPQQTTKSLFQFMGVDQLELDFNNIPQYTNESDSYHRMKYRHKIRTSVDRPKGHNEIPISPRILSEIESRFAWYYQQYYPDILNGTTLQEEALQFVEIPAAPESSSTHVIASDDIKDDDLVGKLDVAIQKEIAPQQ